MRCKTDSYVLELPLEAGAHDRRELNHRFFLANRVYNCMVSEAEKRLNQYYLLPEVKDIRKRMRKKGYQLTAEEKKLLAQARTSCGLSEYAFHAFLKVQAQKFRRWLDANTVQKLGTRCWQAVSSVLFDKGKQIHYQRYSDLDSLEGKTNKQGIMFQPMTMKMTWKGLTIPAHLRKHDHYAEEALLSKIKYCRIVRRMHASGFRYALQLVLEGTPPPKRDWRTGEFRQQRQEAAVSAVAGYDPGTSTLAAVSAAGIVWQEYGSDVDRRDQEIHRLQRHLDRQRRTNNPDRFAPDGQYIRIKKGEKRPPWQESRRMRKTRADLRRTWRRRSSDLKRAQYETANQIIGTVGCHIIVEETNFAALAKRSKKTTVNPKTGRYRSKRRFGRSVLKYAPSRQITLLEQKAKQAGGGVLYADPRTAKGSQYNHMTDTYDKVDLNTRWKELVPGIWVARDPYSAFLYSCYDPVTGKFDRDRCIREFPQFYAHQIVALLHLVEEKKRGKVFPSCMGLDDIPQPLLAAITFD